MTKKLSLKQMNGLSIDQIIDLYKHDYRLETNDVKVNKAENKAENITGDTKNKDTPSIMAAVNRLVDPFVNFGKATVSTGYDDSATTIILTTGNGSRFPNPSIDGEFNLVWWNSTDYSDPSDDPNKEIIRCTARSDDTLTIIRAEEDTSASDKNLFGKTYSIVLPITAKTITDLQTDAQARVDAHSAQTSTHGVAGNIVGTSDVQVLTNKFIIDPTNSVMANLLKTSAGSIDISTSDTPSIGQVLTATSPTTAKWQNLAGPTCFFASILGSPSSGAFPLAVYFNATIIGGAGPYTYSWGFGDGGISTNPAPFHTYTYNGTFTATLLVTDSVGNTASSATIITVLTGVGIVASGLGITESMSIRDYSIGFFNTAPIIAEAYSVSDSLAGMYNAGPVMLDDTTVSDSLAGMYNASAYQSSPFEEGITQSEGLAMISSLTIPGTGSVTIGNRITISPSCFLYGIATSCPLLTWSSSAPARATVDQNGVVTGVTPGTTNITATSAGVTSNICVVTVS